VGGLVCTVADIQQMIGRRLFFGEGPMLVAWNREERYRDLAEECRRLAVTSFSIQMSNRYWGIAECYSTLHDAEGARHTSLRRLTASIAPNGWRLAGASVRPTTPPRPSPNPPLARARGFALRDPVEST
jgi:hypothetical protein